VDESSSSNSWGIPRVFGAVAPILAETFDTGEEAGILVGLVLAFVALLMLFCLLFYAIEYRRFRYLDSPEGAKSDARYTVLTASGLPGYFERDGGKLA
jgi:hypothetical protein